MSRATQWEPLCGTDPTPGEPDQVAKAGRHYVAMAEEIDGQVQRLKDIVSGTLQGGYVQTLTNAAEGLQDDLSRTSGRYREVGGTLQQWAPQLNDFQDEAERLRQQAVTAAGGMSANQVMVTVRPPDAPPPTYGQVAEDNARQGRYDDARGDLRRAQGRLLDLADRRDAAASKVADDIREESDDGLANSAWDDFQGWMDRHHEMVSEVAKVLGVIAMAACVVALVVPGLNIVAAAGLVAGAGSMLGHVALASTDNGSWWDVGMDGVALATMGTGRFLGPGLKVLGREFGGALKAVTAETKAAGAMARGNAARAPVQAGIRADVLQAEQRLVGGASGRVTRGVRREVGAIRAQGVSDSQHAFDAAESAYGARVTTTTRMERLLLGGGDAEIATLRVAAQHAAQGFSTTSSVGLASAKATTQYAKAVGFTGASTVTSLLGLGTDFVKVKWYEDWTGRSLTREGGSL
jgi:hypothetical protein